MVLAHQQLCVARVIRHVFYKRLSESYGKWVEVCQVKPPNQAIK